MLLIVLFQGFIIGNLPLMIKRSIVYSDIIIGTISSSDSVLICGSDTRRGFMSDLSDIINLDGISDFSVSVPTGFTLGKSSCCNICGFSNKFNGALFQINLTTFVQGFKIISSAADNKAEQVINGTCDFNNDGINDIIIRDLCALVNSSKVYIVFGTAVATRADLDLAQFNSNTGVLIHETDYFYNGSTGFKILRETINKRIGLFLHSAGIVNQNGVHDWINAVSDAKSLEFWTEHNVVECIKIVDFTPLLQNKLGQETQSSCTMLDNSTPEIITLQPNKNQTLFTFCPTILIISIVLLCGRLRNMQSDSSTGGACSSSALEILKRREKIRYVFQHYPSYFIDVSYILSSLYIPIVS